MTTVLTAANLAQVSEAAYANLIDPATGQLFDVPSVTINRIRDVFGSEFQATRFVSNDWRVVDQYTATVSALGLFGSGFSGTLFQNIQTGRYALALRGTESGIAGAVSDLLRVDLLDIVADGVAIDQVVDMYNYFRSLSADSGLVYQAARLEYMFTETATLQALALLPGSGSSGSPYNNFLEELKASGALIDFTLSVGQIVRRVQFGPSNVLLAGTPIALGKGLMVEPVPFDLTGHSLGGHLAAAFTRLFPNAPTLAVTMNGAGFPTGTTPGLGGQALSNIQNLFAALDGASSFDPAKILNLYGSGPTLVSMNQQWGLVQQGATQEVYIEAMNLSTAFGHAVAQLTDSLAMYDVLARLDAGLRNATIGEVHAALKPLLEAASNVATSSLERTADILTGLFAPQFARLGNQDNRDELYKRIVELRTIAAANVAANTPITLASLIGMAPGELTARVNAANALAYRYALRELNPFAVLGPDSLYAPHNTGSSAGTLELYLSREGTPSGVGMSAAYVADRAQMLAFLIKANTSDVTSLASSDVEERVIYRDLALRPAPGSSEGKATTLEVFRPGGTTRPTPSQIKVVEFGTDGANVIEGRTNDDRLYGGAGTDALSGRAGNDYLEGGAGLDLYQLSAQRNLIGADTSVGADTILDTDGKGVLRYSFTEPGGTLGLSTQTTSRVIVEASVKVNDTTWTSADGKVRYEKLGADLKVTLLREAGSTTVDGTLLLKDFREGDFGIRLWSARSDPSVLGTLQGDRSPEDADPNVPDVQLAYDFWGNVRGTADPQPGREDALFGDAAAGEALAGGDGNDILFGDTPMMAVPGPRTGFDPLASGGADWLQGDTGRDTLDGGPGYDLLEGGFGGSANGDAGGDILFGGLGDDTLWGDYRSVDIGAAIRNAETDASSTLKGDFLSGGAGEDWLIGSDAKDALMGGGGEDLLVGGAGDDTIFGDLGWTASTLAWTATRPQQGYLTTFSGTVTADTTAGAGDVIYGGGGADWIAAEAGDDYVDGGAGEDVIGGGEGADVILGGAENDVLFGGTGVESDADAGDYLDGGAGDDKLFGNGGDDILVGGAGNDVLQGGAGKDIYIFDKGDVVGDEFIDDVIDTATSAEASLLVLNGVNRDDIKFRPGSLMIDLGDGARIHLDGFDQVNPENTPLIGELRFDDGQVMSYADILAQGFDIDGTAGDDDAHDAAHPQLLGTGVTDRIRGFAGNDVLAGLGGNDILEGGAGADELQGGEGDDYLIGDGLQAALADQTADRLFGGAGADILEGNGGNDELYGGAGDDQVTGGEGDDFASGEGGSDRLFGGVGADTLTGGAGDDLLSGGAGNDTLSADQGADEILGGAGDDLLYGAEGADQLAGNEGNDTLAAGTGDDVLFGGAGNDLYIFDLGDGQDYIDDAEGVNTVRFGAGISAASLTVTRTDPALAEGYLFIGYGAGDSLTIKNGAQASTIQSFEFADGTTRTQAQLVFQATVVDPDLQYTLYGTTQGEFLAPSIPGQFRIYGAGGDDTLQGGASDDVIDGGDGNDTLNGLAGSNTYLFARGAGADAIANASSGGNDTLTFAADILPADVTLSHEANGDLKIALAGSDDSVTVQGYYTANGAHLEHIVFGDGSIQDMAAVQALEVAPITPDAKGAVTGTPYADTLLGDAGANTLDGGAGDDMLEGGAGTDTYLVKLGMRRDVVIEQTGEQNMLRLAPGLEFAELRATREQDDLVLGIRGTPDGVVLKGYYAVSQDWRVETDAGASKDLPVLLAELSAPSAGDVVQQARDAWRSGTKNFLFSQLDSGYVQTGPEMFLKTDGAFQDYYSVIERSSSGFLINGHINSLYSFIGAGELEDFGIAPEFSTTVQVPLGRLGLEGTASGGSSSGGAFENLYLVDYGRLDASGNPLFVGTPDFNGGWTAQYLDLSTLTQGGTGATGTSGGNASLPVTVTQVNSIDGLTIELITGDGANNSFTPWGFSAIDGGDGDDVINATGWVWEWDQPYGGDFLYGGAGNDRIFGSDDADVLVGGEGNDYLAGTGGSDTFLIVAQQAGRKIVDESVVHYWLPAYYVTGTNANGDQGADTVEFSQGIDLEDLQFSWGQFDSTAVDSSGAGRRYATLNLSWAPDRAVNVILPDPNYAGSWGVEFFTFADGITVTMADMLARATAQAGARDPAAYYFSQGDGPQTLTDRSGLTTLRFGPGIDPDNIATSRAANDLLITHGSDQLRVANWYAGATPHFTLMFDDGTIWGSPLLGLARISGTEQADFLIGTAGDDAILGKAGDDFLLGSQGNDVLNGGPGRDQLSGQSGADTYVFSRGDGADAIYDEGVFSTDVDTIFFTSDVKSADIGATTDGANGIYLVNTGSGDRIRIANWFNLAAMGHAYTVRFADGTQWTAAEVESMAAVPQPATQGHDVLVGSAADDHVDALGGNDYVMGLAGNDVLAGGAGDDRIEGGEGSDVLSGGAGNDEIEGGEGDDILSADAGDDYLSDWGAGNNLLEGGAGNDYVYEEGHALVIGGPGDDWIDSWGPGAVIAFNRRDGNDVVYVADSLTLSLGGGIGAADLVLSEVESQYTPDVKDLLLSIGAGDSIRLSRQWEQEPQAWPQIALQMFGSVHAYDFNAVIAGFRAALAADPGLGSFALSEVLPAHETSFSLTDGLGGAIAWQYAATGSTSGLSAAQIQSVLADPGFGAVAQPISLASANHAPAVANAIADQAASEDAAFSFLLPADVFVDPDAGDALAYTAALEDGAALPSWLGFDAATRTFSGTPLQADVGSFAVRVTAADPGGLSAADSFTVSVAAVNDAPVVLTPIADRVATEYLPFGLSVAGAFADADPGDSLTYAASLANGSDLPAWLAFDASTQTFSGSPVASDLGTYDVTLTATDSGGLSAVDSFNVTVAPTPDQVIVGSDGDDELAGRSGNDRLDGGLGADTMRGALGNDTYVVDDAGDVVIENPGEGIDAVESSVAYVLPDNVERLTLTGAAGIDGTGNSRANVIAGNSGDNLIDGGGGVDTMAGGTGNDTYIVNKTGDVVIEKEDEGLDTVRSAATYALPANVENLVLTGTASIRGTGNELANAISGNSVANTIDGGAGADRLAGGAGNDTYLIDDAGDTVIESPGEGTDTVKALVSYALGDNVENLTLIGTAAIGGAGNALNNVITGNEAASALAGGEGNDTYVIGFAGVTVIENAAAGTDTVKASVTYALPENVENLTLTGVGNLNGYGNALGNVLRGNAGANLLEGYGGDDTLYGNLANDILRGGADGDSLRDSGGSNLLDGGASNDSLAGNAGNELYAGGAGNDSVNTGGGADLIAFNRGDGQDTVAASQGADNTLSLGGGIGYADLAFRKSGSNLILQSGLNAPTGASERIVFSGWYSTTADNRSVARLQLFAETMPGFDPSSSDSLLNRKVQSFDFLGLVDAFDAARRVNPAITSWALTNALSQNYLGGSDAAAIGGDLARWYGRAGQFSGLALGDAQQILNAPEFGAQAQPIAQVQEGGAGNDSLNGGDGSDFMAGGAGDDVIRTGAGSNVIAYNGGDGADTVISSAGASNALSLGGGIGYADLGLSKIGDDLVLRTSADDRVTFKDWYAGKANVLDLQVILDATGEFDAQSQDPLRDHRVQRFDFRGIVSQFDQALAQSPGLTTWAVTSALLQFHLSGEDDAAIGGDLGYWYGKYGNLAGISLQAAQQVIGAPGFGAEAQSLRPFSGLQEGLVKLA